MRELVFLLEELSAKVMLEGLLPRLLDPSITVRLIPFEGKQDLERQLIKRLRGYQNSQARFIVLRDQDSHPDCKLLKTRLVDLCQQSGRNPNTRVRIACRELEAFYLGDLAAVGRALDLPTLERHQNKAKFRNPDKLGSPSAELFVLTARHYQKVSGSRLLGRHLNTDNNRSSSFNSLVAGIRRAQHELLAL